MVGEVVLTPCSLPLPLPDPFHCCYYLRHDCQLSYVISLHTRECSDLQERRDHQVLLDALRDAAKGELFQTLDDLERVFLNLEFAMDTAVIRACKRMLCLYLLENRDAPLKGGLTITTAIMHFWYDGFIWSVRKQQV